MMKISRYLFFIFVSGIFVISVSAVCAQQRFPTTAPQSTTSGEEGGKAGIIVVDGTFGGEGVEGRTSDTSIEPGDNFQPRPGTTLKPGGPDTLQRKDVPRGQRGIGGVIPPDFDDDTTNR